MFRRFNYLRPSSLAQAIDALAGNEEAEVLAGGTDLLLKLRESSRPGELLVDIKRCPGLEGIEQLEDCCFIGALTTVQAIAESSTIKDNYRALWDAATVFGCYEIRNRATLGGNIVHASPGAESGTPLFAFDAQVEIAGPKGTRRMGIQEFWTGAGKVALERGEILTGVRLPRYERKMVSRYQRISRTKGMDLAALGVTVAVISPDNPAKREVRVAMAAVERTPYRNAEVESLLSGRVLDDQVVASAKKLMAISIHPRDTSIRAKPFYKRAMVGTLAERILDELSLVEA